MGRFLNLVSDADTRVELTRLYDHLGGSRHSVEIVSWVSPTLRQRVRRLSTSNEQALVAAYLEGAKIDELAQSFGVHRTTVMACLNRQRVSRRQRGLHPRHLSEAIRLYGDGWSSIQLGERFSVDARTVRKSLVEQGVEIRPRRGWRPGHDVDVTSGLSAK